MVGSDGAFDMVGKGEARLVERGEVVKHDGYWESKMKMCLISTSPMKEKSRRHRPTLECCQ